MRNNIDDIFDLYHKAGLVMSTPLNGITVAAGSSGLGPSQTNGLTPNATIYDFEKDDHYLAELFIRNAKSLLDWIKDQDEVTEKQHANLTAMLEGEDVESIKLAIMLIETKQKIILEKSGIQI